MTPHELRATLDRRDLSAAEAGHLLGVHRATISVPIVVELLLRLMVRRGIRGRADRRRNRQSRLSTTIHVPGPSRPRCGLC
jgi:hypothetical protein